MQFKCYFHSKGTTNNTIFKYLKEKIRKTGKIRIWELDMQGCIIMEIFVKIKLIKIMLLKKFKKIYRHSCLKRGIKRLFNLVFFLKIKMKR